MDKETGEILSSEIVAIVGGVIAGLILSIFIKRLELVPGVLILLPGFLGMRGNISGSLAARIGSSLHLGTLKPEFKNTRILRDNILAGLTLAVIVSLFLGFIAYFFTMFVFRVDYPIIILISLLAGLISNFVQMPVTVIVSFYLFSRGYDPDNIMGPYITTLGDVISVVSLLLVIMVVV